MKTLGPYAISGEIARGGMGVIYKATDPATQRDVAIKVLLVGQRNAEVAQRRFAREAAALAKLRHPNVVAVHSVGVDEGRPFLVMDYVDGASLDVHLEREVFAPTRAVKIVKALAEAVHYGHERGVLHRDIKPSNVILAGETPKLTDYGLAKDVDSRSRLTETGHYLGTPGFWSPEQARGAHDRVGPATDVYGLGATLYALLCGQAPFSGGSLVELMLAMERGQVDPPSVHEPTLPPALDAVCLQCLEYEPDDRYRSASALAEELGRYLKGEPVLARGRTPLRLARSWVRHNAVLLVLGAVALLGVVAAAVGGPAARPSPTPVPEPVAAAESPPDPSLQPQLAPEPGATWRELNALARRALRAGDPEWVARRLGDPTVREALAAGGAEVQSGRRALASRFVDQASALHPERMTRLSAATAQAMLTWVRVARDVLPQGETLERAQVKHLVDVYSTRLGLGDGDDADVQLARLGLAVNELVADPELLAALASLSLRSLCEEAVGELEPAGRKLVASDEDPRHLYVLAALLLRSRAPDGLEVSKRALEVGGLRDLERGDLHQRRGVRLKALRRFDEALVELRAALHLRPGIVGQRVDLAETLILAEQFDEAWEVGITLLKGIPWRHPGRAVPDVRSFRFVAGVLWGAGGRTRDPVLVRDVFRKLIEVGDTLHAHWPMRLVILEFLCGDMSAAGQALRDFVRFLERRGRSWAAFAPRVRECLNTGPLRQTPEALAQLETLLEEATLLKGTP